MRKYKTSFFTHKYIISNSKKKTLIRYTKQRVFYYLHTSRNTYVLCVRSEIFFNHLKKFF